jgi:WXG100 family type VII secretion target
MGEMSTSAPALKAEATNFDRIGGELTQMMGQVEATAGELASHVKGQAGTAIQQALARFKEKQQQSIAVLNEIQTNISQAGIQYEKADDEQSSSIASEMNF